MIFGKNRKIYFIVFLGLTAATIGLGMIWPNLYLVLGACAFTALVLLIVDIFNVRRFGSFYGIDVINNQIIEISEKKGEKIVNPEDIEEIVQPVDMNLTGPGRMNHEERYFYIKLKDGSNLGVSAMVSGYDELVGKVKDFAIRNNLTEKAKITGIFNIFTLSFPIKLL
jgi:hypothetical protein